ncbi:MAG: DUF5110 domain-containing protein [Muribaculaceae bacterium]|nr:DUF5110 domain-containing protein [Muribaculaceae bacterium]
MKIRIFACAMWALGALSAAAANPIVEFVTPGIARVRWNPEGQPLDNATGACVYEAGAVPFRSYTTAAGIDVAETDSLRVEVDPAAGGAMTFARRTPDGWATVLATLPGRTFGCDTVVRTRTVYDDASGRMVDTANGKVTVKDTLRVDTLGTARRFTLGLLTGASEGIYGLGAHMEDYMNLRGKTMYLTQHNLKAFVPVLVSTAGYGLLFDAGCSMKYESVPAGGAFETVMEMEAARTIDFYFILGPEPERVVAGYRYLTGPVSMMPRYLFGYAQSKERYVSSDDIVATVKEYRRRRVPLDMIVQDWNYWPQGWGYMKMNREYYPSPRALADSVHALDARLMVSIWANPQYCPEEEDFRSRGFMLEHSVYDAFNPDARDLYWDYARREFFDAGFDAWWCDSSEPLDGDWNVPPEPEGGVPYSADSHERRWRLNDAILSETLGAERACLYSLNHSRGIYEHQRAASDAKRVVNLTRSTWAGQQRYGTIVWNGDTHASWESFRQQIPAGLNYLATGNPYWTMDAGSFFVRPGERWFYRGEWPAGVADEGYREYYTRMLQWAAFLPVMRSHGTDTPREIWNFGEEGTPHYDAILRMIRLRYSLMPYIYSMAAAQSAGGYSMARPLAFDFPADTAVHDVKDQYMFGNIMVCPVTAPGATSRSVYLPETGGGWIDWWTGERLTGGRVVDAPAPLHELPLYVRAGSIVTTCAPAQHSAEAAAAPVTITVYPGADATFTLYDDAGDGYAFERGESVSIPLLWNDAEGTLTIGRAQGSYPAARSFSVQLAGAPATPVDYDGSPLCIKL